MFGVARSGFLARLLFTDTVELFTDFTEWSSSNIHLSSAMTHVFLLVKKIGNGLQYSITENILFKTFECILAFFFLVVV